MALFDNLFGTPPEYLTGLLGQEDLSKLQSKANTTGLINTALAFIAQPRNQRYGSALPYLGKALMAGQQSGQNVYENALRGFETQQKLEELKRQKEQRAAYDKAFGNLYTTTPAVTESVSGGYAPAQTQAIEGQVAPNFGLTKLPDTTREVTPARREFNPQALMELAATGDPRAANYLSALKTYKEITSPEKGESPFAKIDPSKFTKESINLFNQTGNYALLEPVEKPQLTEAIKNFEYAKENGYQGSFENWAKSLTAYQLAQLGIDKSQLDLAIQESQYKYGTPLPQMPQSVTMQDVSDTARASGKTTSQVIQDLKSKGIKVQGAR